MEARKQIFSIFAGAQGSGKSFLVRKIADAYKKKVLFIDTGTDDDNFEDYEVINEPREIANTTLKRKLFYVNDPKFFEVMQTDFKNGLIIFDDGNFFMTNSKNEPLIKMMMIRRQLNIDIIFICHGLTEIAPRFWPFANRLVLFETLDNLKRKAGNIPNFEYWEQQQKLVNDTSRANPKLYYHKVYDLRARITDI